MFAMLLYVTFGLILVLALRRWARQLFGAGPAFTLWLLPPLLAMLPWLPRLPSAWTVKPTLLVLPTAPTFFAQAIPGPSTMPWPLLLWLAGTLCCLLRLAFHYGRLRRHSRRLPAAMCHTLQRDLHGLDPSRLRLHPAGPAVLWAPRSLVLLPADFLERFDADERRLVLQHEYTHLRRGDALWSLLAELATALLWFHPLAWLALPRLRLDQELACDERVLRQSPQHETKYAHALLHSTGMAAMPVLIPWLAQPQLKERLSMIQRHRPGAWRRRIGFIAVASLMTGAAFVRQAAADQSSPASATTSPGTSYVMQGPPVYSADAVKNKEQSTFVLLVLVGPDGKPIKVKAEATTKVAPDVIKAATNLAMYIHFNPAIKNGKPIESYVRVPFTPAPSASTRADTITSPSI